VTARTDKKETAEVEQKGRAQDNLFERPVVNTAISLFGQTY